MDKSFIDYWKKGIDFYIWQSALNPNAPIIVGDEGGPTVLLKNDVSTANPDFRLMVTGDYHLTTDGNYWELPYGAEFGDYTLTITGAANENTLPVALALSATVPAPASWTLLVLGILLLLLQSRSSVPAPATLRRNPK